MSTGRARRLFLLVLFTLLIGTAMPMTAWASLPYATNYKSKTDLVWTQSAYYPVEVLGREIFIPDAKDPAKQVASPMVQPKDLFIANNDHMYVADTGNNRIVHFDQNGDFVETISPKSSPLAKPEGVFVTDNGDIYVADTGNKRVVWMDKTGKLLKEYKRPDSRFIPEAFKYDPIKVVVDKRGFLYIATLGGYQGLLQLDSDGNFQRFFGANKTATSVMDALKKALYTKQMYANEISKLPGSVNNVAIDKDGFIYTTTTGDDVKKQQIKKLNIAGQDFLAGKSENTNVKEKSFGEKKFEKGTKLPQLTDVSVDKDGNITAIDSNYKYINQYDSYGNLLFFWSGNPNPSTIQLGIVKTPVSIAANSKNELFILDGQANVIQQFRLSQFGELVHKANQFSLEGKYEESEQYWKEVLRLNAFYTPAFQGLAKASYKKQDFETAMELFKKAGNQQGYSDAYWQVRLKWFQNNFGLFMNIVIIGGIALWLLNKFTKKRAFRKKWKNRSGWQFPLWVQLKHSFHILRHPIDGFSALRYERKGSVWSALILLVAAYIALCITRLYTSFTYNAEVTQTANLFNIFIQWAVIWFGWVVCNYLISSIKGGEGRFRDVFIGNAYVILPVIIIGIPLAIISNGMTLSESAIFGFFSTAITIWLVLLLFWNVQSMQNYSVGETAMNIFLSICTMVLFASLIFILFGLSTELKDFIYSVYQEVSIR